MKRSRVNPTNPERRRDAYERNFGERADAVRAMRCLVHRPGVVRLARNACQGDIVAAHVRARGMGGAHGSRFDICPLCARHHDEAGEIRTSKRAAFEAKYGVDLQAEAERIAAELTEQGYP